MTMEVSFGQAASAGLSAAVSAWVFLLVMVCPAALLWSLTLYPKPYKPKAFDSGRKPPLRRTFDQNKEGDWYAPGPLV